MGNNAEKGISTSKNISIDVSTGFLGLIASFVMLRIWDYWVLMRFAQTLTSGAWWIHPYALASLFALGLAVVPRNGRHPEGPSGRGGASERTGRLATTATLVTALLASGAASATILTEGTHPAAALVLFVTQGALIVVMWYRCLRAFACLPQRTFVVGIVVGSMAVLLVQLFMTLLPTEVSTAFALLLPPVGCLLLERGSRGMSFRRDPLPTIRRKDGLRGPAMTFGCIGILVFVYSFMNAFLKASHGSYAFSATPMGLLSFAGHALALLIFAVLAWRAVRADRTVDVTSLLAIPVLLLAVAILLVVFGCSSAFVQVLTFASVSVLIPCSWLVAVDIARRSDLSPGRVCATGLASFFLPSYLGQVAYRLLSPLDLHLTLNTTQTLAVCCLGVMLTLLVVRPEGRGRTHYLVSEDPRAEAPTVGGVSVEDRLTDLGRRYDLSEREVTIAGMLYRGKSKGAIAEELALSENTVRTYTKRLYRKLDIHDRDGLLERLGL